MNKVKILTALTLTALENRINSEINGEIVNFTTSQSQNGQYVASIIYSQIEPKTIKLDFSKIKAYIEKDGIRLVCDPFGGPQLSCGHGGGLMTIDEAIDALIKVYKDDYIIIFNGNVNDINKIDPFKPEKPKISLLVNDFKFTNYGLTTTAECIVNGQKYSQSCENLYLSNGPNYLIEKLIELISQDYTIDVLSGG